MILTSLHIDALSTTLVNAKKFMGIDRTAAELKVDYSAYIDKVSSSSAWEQKRTFTVTDKTAKTVTPYTYKDIFTSEKAVADNFIMYLKTNKMPDEYEDADSYLASVIGVKTPETAEQKSEREKKEAEDKAAETARIRAEKKSTTSVESIADRIKPVEGKVNTYTYAVQKWGSPDAIKKAMAKQFPATLASARSVDTKPKNGKSFGPQEVVTVHIISKEAALATVPNAKKEWADAKKTKDVETEKTVTATKADLTALKGTVVTEAEIYV
jgi:hypothetical protein